MKFDKRAYNRAQYLKKKAPQVTTLPAPRPKLLWFLLPFIGCMSLFLLTEASGFYLSVGESQASSYFKAGLLEGAIIVFTLLKPTSNAMRILHRVILTASCVFGIWIVSGSVIHSTIMRGVKLTALESQIQSLESEIEFQTTIRNEYLKLGRLKLAAPYNQSLNSLRTSLNSSQDKLTATPPQAVLLDVLGIQTIFRLLILVSNLCCLKYVRDELSFRL